MAKKPETIFKEKVLGHLHALPLTWVVKIQQVSIRGTPDLLACINGHFVAIELKKSSKEKPDPLQQYTLDLIEKAHGLALAVDPEAWPEAFEFLKSLACGPQLEVH